MASSTPTLGMHHESNYTAAGNIARTAANLDNLIDTYEKQLLGQLSQTDGALRLKFQSTFAEMRAAVAEFSASITLHGRVLGDNTANLADADLQAARQVGH